MIRESDPSNFTRQIGINQKVKNISNASYNMNMELETHDSKTIETYCSLLCNSNN